MQRNADVVTLGLADERPRDELDLRLSVCFDVLEHRRIVRRPSPRREHVHLPGVVVELDAGSDCDRLALVNEPVDEVAEIRRLPLGREVRVVGEAGQRRDRS